MNITLSVSAASPPAPIVQPPIAVSRACIETVAPPDDALVDLRGHRGPHHRLRRSWKVAVTNCSGSRRAIGHAHAHHAGMALPRRCLFSTSHGLSASAVRSRFPNAVLRSFRSFTSSADHHLGAPDARDTDEETTAGFIVSIDVLDTRAGHRPSGTGTRGGRRYLSMRRLLVSDLSRRSRSLS